MHPDSSRRRFLGQCAAAATAASLVPSFAWAQGDGYPSVSYTHLTLPTILLV